MASYESVNITCSLNPRSITDEELAKIVKRALQSPTEANYILTLDVYKNVSM